MEVCNNFRRGYKDLCGFCGHKLYSHGPKISIEQYIAEETARLKQFEDWWEQEIRHRSPDEMPDEASLTNPTVWRDRYDEYLSDQV